MRTAPFFYPEMFDLEEPSPPLLIYPSDEPIDGIAHLTYPVIVPEHKRIYDSGLMLARVPFQATSERVSNAIRDAIVSPKPLPDRLREAVLAYITACSIKNRMMRFAGFVICLEALCRPQKRPKRQLDALQTIVAAIEDAKVGAIDPIHAEMVRETQNAIGRIGNISSTGQFRRLIVAHAVSIAARLDPNHPWATKMAKAANTVYGMRGKIVHFGTWGASQEIIHLAQNFVTEAAKAVLLDELAELSGTELVHPAQPS